MSIEQRRHIRFSLDIPARRFSKYGDARQTLVQQVSIGGCLLEWDEEIYVGDEFRLLIQLPNKNFLPLACKALYKFENNGIGTKFFDITQFEQELVAKIISHHLTKQGLPMQVDPFALPRRLIQSRIPQLSNERREIDQTLENILSTDKPL